MPAAVRCEVDRAGGLGRCGSVEEEVLHSADCAGRDQNAPAARGHYLSVGGVEGCGVVGGPVAGRASVSYDRIISCKCAGAGQGCGQEKQFQFMHTPP